MMGVWEASARAVATTMHAALTASGSEDKCSAPWSRKKHSLQQSQCKFAHDNDQDDQEYFCGMGEYIQGIDQHPHRHEEQDSKCFAEWGYLSSYLVAEGRLIQHNTSQECTKRQGNSKERSRTL